jgi:hypothetical protein
MGLGIKEQWVNEDICLIVNKGGFPPLQNIKKMHSQKIYHLIKREKTSKEPQWGSGKIEGIPVARGYRK